MRGFFNNNGQPKIGIEVQGTNPVPGKIDAIIDSGFNGYLKIPYAVAFPLGLALVGIQSHTIADGSSVDYFVCKGSVCVDGKCIDTTIDIHPAEIILIGTSLLKELKKVFIMDADAGIVEITDSEAPVPKKAFEIAAK